jgi:hypothetical protein
VDFVWSKLDMCIEDSYIRDGFNPLFFLSINMQCLLIDLDHLKLKSNGQINLDDVD